MSLLWGQAPQQVLDLYLRQDLYENNAFMIFPQLFSEGGGDLSSFSSSFLSQATVLPYNEEPTPPCLFFPAMYPSLPSPERCLKQKHKYFPGRQELPRTILIKVWPPSTMENLDFIHLFPFPSFPFLSEHPLRALTLAGLTRSASSLLRGQEASLEPSEPLDLQLGQVSSGEGSGLSFLQAIDALLGFFFSLVCLYERPFLCCSGLGCAGKGAAKTCQGLPVYAERELWERSVFAGECCCSCWLSPPSLLLSLRSGTAAASAGTGELRGAARAPPASSASNPQPLQSLQPLPLPLGPAPSSLSPPLFTHRSQEQSGERLRRLGQRDRAEPPLLPRGWAGHGGHGRDGTGGGGGGCDGIDAMDGVGSGGIRWEAVDAMGGDGRRWVRWTGREAMRWDAMGSYGRR